MFKKAERKQSKLRLAISGPSGSGKTLGALLIAKGLGGSIAVLDTENGSASLYAEKFDFDVVNLSPPYSPERFIEVVKAAEKAGYSTLIIDSSTHEWSGTGGCLEIVDKLANSKFKSNSWSAWSEVTPRHRAYIDAMLQSSMHIITTMRSKTETAQVEVNGRKQVQKLGMKAEQRDGIEYEFTVVLDVVHDSHFAIASKDRTQLFDGEPQIITVETGTRLLDWLNSGKAEVGAPKPAPVQSASAIEPESEPVLIDVLQHLKALTNAINLAALNAAAKEIPKGISEKDRETLGKAYNKRKAELTTIDEARFNEIQANLKAAEGQNELEKVWKNEVEICQKLLSEHQLNLLNELFYNKSDEIHYYETQKVHAEGE